MITKTNWFFIFSILLFVLFTVYALFLAITALGTGTALLYTLIIAAALLLVFFLPKLPRINIIQLKLPEWFDDNKAEATAVSGILLVAFAVRVWVIRTFPFLPSSDFETYYRVAELLYHGGLSASGYSGYIAEFPHIIGYPFVLSLFFHITGPSYLSGLYLNAAASTITAFIVYKIAYSLGGRFCSFIALIATAFWPSQLLYSAVMASEPIFSCFFFLCVLLFIYLFRFRATIESIEGSMFLCFILGLALAVTNAIRPMAAIFLIAVILCFVPNTVKFEKNEKWMYSPIQRFACQGWFRALIVLLSFLFVGNFLSKAISNAIAFDLPGGLSSSGFNLLIGTNVEARGAWNQADADFLAANFAATNSAAFAQKACFDEALLRISRNPVAVLRLTFEKLAYLWANDDYANYWVSLFLTQQNKMNAARQALIGAISAFNAFYYSLFILFSAVFGLRFFKEKHITPVHALVLLFVGTAVLHMVLECQNRYHYFLLPVLAILSSLAISEIRNKKSKG